MDGTIFSIEEFAVNDGPGNQDDGLSERLPLRCRWCHNPEGMAFAPQILKKKNGAEEICGERVSPRELAGRLLRNERIFRMNEGGVTFTGGEPLAQPQFLFETMELLKGRVHIALETSAHAPPEIFRRAAELADLILIDCKSCDPEVHKKFTGVGNARILENLKYLCGSGAEVCRARPADPLGKRHARKHVEALGNTARRQKPAARGAFEIQ